MANITIGTWCHRGTLLCESQSTAEATTDATPRKIAAPTWAKSGESGLTVDTTGGDIEIDEAGDYLVSAAISFSGTLSKTFHCEIYIDTTGTGAAFTRKLGTGGDVGSAGIGGTVLTLAAGEVLSVYHSGDGSAFTVTDMQLTAIRLS